MFWYQDVCVCFALRLFVFLMDGVLEEQWVGCLIDGRSTLEDSSYDTLCVLCVVCVVCVHPSSTCCCFFMMMCDITVIGSDFFRN